MQLGGDELVLQGISCVERRWVVTVVTDCRNINKTIQRPVHPSESGNQVLRHIKASSKYFAICAAGGWG